MASVAANARVERECLYKSLSGDTSPAFETVHKALDSFGLKMVVEPVGRRKGANAIGDFRAPANLQWSRLNFTIYFAK